MTTTSSETVYAVVAAPVEHTYDTICPIDPVEFFPQFGPLPAVIAVRDQSGEWNAIGRTRQLQLSDGGHVIETITDARSPAFFAYDLADFQRLFGKLVSGARAEWRFTAVDGGTRIGWTYSFHGLAGRGWIVALIVKSLWRPYMRRVLSSMSLEVERTIAPR